VNCVESRGKTFICLFNNLFSHTVIKAKLKLKIQADQNRISSEALRTLRSWAISDFISLFVCFSKKITNEEGQQSQHPRA